MHVSKEFLLEAVSLSLLVALILVSMQMYQRATKITALLTEEQERQITELEEYEIVKYDGMFLDGMTAISYIKRMMTAYGLPVRVVTVNGEFVIGQQSEFENLRNVKSEKYMNPMAKYRCEIQRNENEVITEISIVVEKKGE